MKLFYYCYIETWKHGLLEPDCAPARQVANLEWRAAWKSQLGPQPTAHTFLQVGSSSVADPHHCHGDPDPNPALQVPRRFLLSLYIFITNFILIKRNFLGWTGQEADQCQALAFGLCGTQFPQASRQYLQSLSLVRADNVYRLTSLAILAQFHTRS